MNLSYNVRIPFHLKPRLVMRSVILIEDKSLSKSLESSIVLVINGVAD